MCVLFVVDTDVCQTTSTTLIKTKIRFLTGKDSDLFFVGGADLKPHIPHPVFMSLIAVSMSFQPLI